MLIVVALASVNRATAQDATAQPPAAEDPAHPAWHGSLSLGLAVANGIQSQRSLQLDGDLLRPFSDGGRFVASASRQYQNVTFPSAALLSDRTNIAVGADQNVTKNTVAIVRSLYLKDSQLLVNSRFEELFGYGIHLYDKTKKRIDFQLVPGLSLYNEDLSYADNSGWKSAIGFYEKFSGKFDKVWSVSNSFRFRNDFSDSNRSVESSAALEGMITKSLGLQIGYQYNYESIVPDGFPSFLSMLSAGLKFQF
jgi:putative salt-induced outer membrane protein YdiY